MGSLKKNKKLVLDQGFCASMALVQEGILGKVDKLMNQTEARKANSTGYYKGYPMPFSFILSPAGKRNQETIQNIKSGEIVDIMVNDIKKGEITAEDSFKIDKYKRVVNIFGFYDENDDEIKSVLKNLGDFALSGTFNIQCESIKYEKQKIQNAIKNLNAKKITGIMMGTNPLNRAHERLIRGTLDSTDLLVIFLIKPYKTEGFSYTLRYNILKYYIEQYLPKDKIIIVPLETTYIFSGHNNLILQSIVASNFGCTNFAIGQNHHGIGMFFDNNQMRISFDKYKDELPIQLDIFYEYVYCNKCKTLVSVNNCPHGSHHHVKYNGKRLKELLKIGIMPPAIFMRKDISSKILSHLHPHRFKDLQSLYYDLFPNNGLIEEKTQEDFYKELMKLYQTTSMV